MSDPNEECNCEQALMLKKQVAFLEEYMAVLHQSVLDIATEHNEGGEAITPAWLSLINCVKNFGRDT